MFRLLLVLSIFAFLVTAAEAQTNTGPNAGIGFTAPIDATSLAEAQGMRYRVYVDGSTVGVVSAATCSGDAAPFACRVPLPPMTPGEHTLTMTASRNISGQGEVESVRSAPLGIRVVVAPNPPTELRIVP